MFAQLLARSSEFKKKSAGHLDQATVNAELSREFERRWAEPEGPESMVPGKEVLAGLNLAPKRSRGDSHRRADCKSVQYANNSSRCKQLARYVEYVWNGRAS